MTHRRIVKASLELLNPFNKEGLHAERARDDCTCAVHELSNTFVVPGFDRNEPVYTGNLHGHLNVIHKNRVRPRSKPHSKSSERQKNVLLLLTCCECSSRASHLHRSLQLVRAKRSKRNSTFTHVTIF